jgi:AcrR family transcriptional regulator
MTTVASRSPKRVRLAPEVRRGQLIDAAAALVLEQAHLPVSLERLGEAAGASKALIYAYFPTQHDLFNAVLARGFEALSEAGLLQAVEGPSLAAAAHACASIYFDHVATDGPLIHFILRDHFMIGKVSAANRRYRDLIALRLARMARRELRFAAKENVATFNLVVTIPELAGRMAWKGEMERERAKDLMTDLISSSLEAFGPSRSAPRRPEGL